MHSTQVGLILKLLTSSFLPQYDVIFDDMLSTVARSTDSDPEVWIRMVTSGNSRIQVMLDQECNPDLDYEWFNDNDRLTRLIKARDRIIGRVKGA